MCKKKRRKEERRDEKGQRKFRKGGELLLIPLIQTLLHIYTPHGKDTSPTPIGNCLLMKMMVSYILYIGIIYKKCVCVPRDNDGRYKACDNPTAV